MSVGRQKAPTTDGARHEVGDTPSSDVGGDSWAVDTEAFAADDPPIDLHVQTTPHERRRSLILLSVSLLTIGMGQSLFFAIFPPVARDLGLSEVQVSAIFTLSAILWVIMSPLWGRVSDRVGRKPIILTGIIGFGISTFGMGILLMVGQNGWGTLFSLYILMILTRAIFGFFGAGAPTAAQAYVADRTTRRERTSGVAAIGAAFGMGTVIGPGFAAALASIHILVPFFALGLTALVGALVVFFYLTERRPPKTRRKNVGSQLSMWDAKLRPFLFMGVVVSLTQAAVMQVSAFFIMDTLHVSSDETAQIVGIAMMAMAMATMFAQLVIIPRFDLSVRSLLSSGIWISLIGNGLLLVPLTTASFVLAMTIIGFGMGLLRPGIAAGASLAVDTNAQGVAAGYISSTAAVGIIFVPLVAMPLYLIEPTGPFWLAFILSLAMVVMLWTSRTEVLSETVDRREAEEKSLSDPANHSRY